MKVQHVEQLSCLMLYTVHDDEFDALPDDGTVAVLRMWGDDGAPMLFLLQKNGNVVNTKQTMTPEEVMTMELELMRETSRVLSEAHGDDPDPEIRQQVAALDTKLARAATAMQDAINRNKK